MDFITRLLISRHQLQDYDAVLVVVDRYTKMAKYFACTKEIDAESLATLVLDRLIPSFGVLEGIVTDRGSLFTSSYWSNICYHLKVQRKLSTAFHP